MTKEQERDRENKVYKLYNLLDNITAKFTVTITTEFVDRCSVPTHGKMVKVADLDTHHGLWILNERSAPRFVGTFTTPDTLAINNYDMIILNTLYKKANEAMTL